MCFSPDYFCIFICNYLAKVLNWGEDGMATAAELENLRNAFRKEVSVWNKLDHPNVTKVKVTLCD